VLLSVNIFEFPSRFKLLLESEKAQKRLITTDRSNVQSAEPEINIKYSWTKYFHSLVKVIYTQAAAPLTVK